MTFVAAGDDGKVVMQRGKIALHYLRGWFIFDIVSSLPYEQMIHQGNHGIPTMSIVALLKVSLLEVRALQQSQQCCVLANAVWPDVNSWQRCAALALCVRLMPPQRT